MIMQIPKNRFEEEISGQDLQQTLHKSQFFCVNISRKSQGNLIISISCRKQRDDFHGTVIEFNGD